jgi:hypothetical protein
MNYFAANRGELNPAEFEKRLNYPEIAVGFKSIKVPKKGIFSLTIFWELFTLCM